MKNLAMTGALRRWLALEHVREGVDLDDPSITLLHGRVIRSKRFLRAIYEEHYRFFKDEAAGLPTGGKVEIGSGAGFIKEVVPDAITSDVRPIPGVDMRFSALQMPFDDGSLSAIFAIDVFHHLPDAAAFLREAARCLRVGGKVVMVEPANTPWGRFVYRHFHHEPFQPDAPDWIVPGAGSLSRANGALAWIVFRRDYDRFRREFPALSIRALRFCLPFRYLLSGGVSMKQLVPEWSHAFFKAMEWLMTPVNRYTAMFMRVVLVKERNMEVLGTVGAAGTGTSDARI